MSFAYSHTQERRSAWKNIPKEEVADFTNIPKEEVADFTDQIERRNFAMLFENFEAYDVQETRRISKAEGKAESVLELLEDLGEIPEELKKKIMSQRDMETLKKWHKMAARAESLGKFEQAIEELATGKDTK